MQQMLQKFLYFLFFFQLFNFSLLNAQENHSFFGIIKLKSKTDDIISYRLEFSITGQKVKGYSITDLDGTHETKSIIEGTYNKKTKELIFNETDILYTKSKFKSNDFCFVNFKGKVSLSNNKSKIDGNFIGMFDNKQKCIDGSLSLVGSDKLYKSMTKIEKKIEKTKRIDQDKKDKINPIKLLDSLKINKITKDEDLIVFTKSTKVTVSFYDDAQEDGDVINILQNNQYVLRNYKITKNKKNITLDLAKGENEFTIEAVNEGSISHCTARIEIIDQERSFDLLAILKKDDKAKISIMKR